MITIEPTDIITLMNGHTVRLWRGATLAGPVDVYVAAVATANPEVQALLDDILSEIPDPPEAAVPLWMLGGPK